MVWLGIVLAFIGGLIVWIGRIYIGSRHEKGDPRFSSEVTRSKYMLVVTVVSFVMLGLGAYLILHGLGGV